MFNALAESNITKISALHTHLYYSTLTRFQSSVLFMGVEPDQTASDQVMQFLLTEFSIEI